MLHADKRGLHATSLQHWYYDHLGCMYGTHRTGLGFHSEEVDPLPPAVQTNVPRVNDAGGSEPRLLLLFLRPAALRTPRRQP